MGSPPSNNYSSNNYNSNKYNSSSVRNYFTPLPCSLLRAALALVHVLTLNPILPRVCHNHPPSRYTPSRYNPFPSIPFLCTLPSAVIVTVKGKAHVQVEVGVAKAQGHLVKALWPIPMTAVTRAAMVARTVKR